MKSDPVVSYETFPIELQVDDTLVGSGLSDYCSDLQNKFPPVNWSELEIPNIRKEFYLMINNPLREL